MNLVETWMSKLRAAETPGAYAVLAEFESPEELLEAIRTLRREGYRRLDAFTPFPVHGIEAALGERHSPLGYIVLAGGLTGCAAALLLQWWTGAVAYPLVIAGKPLFAFESSVPIMFELSVLFAAFCAVLGMLALNRLPQFYHPVFNFSRFARATCDRFLLAVECEDPLFDREKTPELLRRLGASHAEVVER